MSLSGNLGFVSLDEVLRLLTRSKQRGSVDVRGEKARGRIFVDRGGVGLATTFTDEHLHRHLIKSGLVEADTLVTVAAGRGDLNGVTDQDGGALTALLREMTVESIYQLGLQGESFEVTEGGSSPYAHPKPFELEDLLADSKQRLTDWSDITSIVSDLDRHLRLRRDLGDRDQITIAKDAWRVLSEVGQGNSVRALAEELGTTEFWTARVAARLIEEDLLTLEQAATVENEPAPSWEYQAPAPVTEPAEPTESTESAESAERIEPMVDAQVTPSSEVTTEMTQVDPNQSWWTEPQPESADESGDAMYAEPAEPAWAEQTAMESATAEMATRVEASEVEEDTEAFLEKVFSDVEPTEEADEGYGLLRRRRMGVLRDLSNE